jgi:acylphosphatase
VTGGSGGALVCRRWVVDGLVQGVGFRWYVLNRAQAMGVRGWVRNLSGGAVEVVGLASGQTIEAFDAVVAAGPPGAHVTRVIREEIPHDSVDDKSFVIKR